MERVYRLRQMVLLAAAGLFCLVGGAFMLTPIPLGIPFLAFGMVLGIGSSPRFAGSVRLIRERVPQLDRFIDYVELKSGARLQRILRQTRPLGAQATDEPDPGTR